MIENDSIDECEDIKNLTFNTTTTNISNYGDLVSKITIS